MRIIEKSAGNWGFSFAPESGAKLLQIRDEGKPLLWNPLGRGRPAWCIGGERTWIAPEYGSEGFHYDPDTGLPQVPPALDPGKYTILYETGRSMRCMNHFALKGKGGAYFTLALTRNLEMDRVDSGNISFRITVSLENRDTQPFPYPIGIWEILQLPAVPEGYCSIGTRGGGTLTDCIHPGRNVEYSRDGNCLSLPSMKEEEFKAGLTATDSDGTLQYYNRSAGYSIRFASLTPPDPGREYADRPARESGNAGDAVQVYSSGLTDDDPFCELELHSPAERLAPGASCTFIVSLQCFSEKGIL